MNFQPVLAHRLIFSKLTFLKYFVSILENTVN